MLSTAFSIFVGASFAIAFVALTIAASLKCIMLGIIRI